MRIIANNKNNAVFFVAYALFWVLVFVGCAEMILRIENISPWKVERANIQVNPGGKFFRKDAELGYTHIPGEFTITLGDGYKFQTTNLQNTLRSTHKITDTSTLKDEIWIFGCSYTYGWSLNDNETYPWLLQERLPEFEVVNFGVNGYGTVHSLIQLRSALKNKTPKVVVLAYADFHDERNTFLRSRQKAVAPWNALGPLTQPYARIDSDGHINFAMAQVEYTEFPLMRYSSLAHFIEMKYDKYEDVLYRSHAVSEALIREMWKLAAAHQVKFVLAKIEGGREILDFASRYGIAAIDISVDLDRPGYRNLPHDGHPSAIADREYAKTLSDFLREKVLASGQIMEGI